MIPREIYIPIIIIFSISYGIYYSKNNYNLTTANCSLLEAKGKTQEFIQCIRDGAQLGHNGKQAALAAFSMEGKYIQQDYNESIKWANKSAKYNNMVAQNLLGVAYQYGYGVQKDYKTSFNWYKKSADQGLPTAIYNLAAMHYNGFGVVKNENIAMKLVTKAAKLGEPNAKALLNSRQQ